MSFIIATRVNGTGRLVIVEDGKPEPQNGPAEYPTEAAAHDAAHTVPVCRAWGYQIVEIE